MVRKYRYPFFVSLITEIFITGRREGGISLLSKYEKFQPENFESTKKKITASKLKI
jgi:hypothetical protein